MTADFIRCCQFNPIKTNQLAVGLFNGTIHIINSETVTVE